VGGSTSISLAELARSVDIVDVCTPTNEHRVAVEAAALMGRAIVCEKPLARTLVDAEAMVAACNAGGARLFVAHVARYVGEYAAAKAAVEAGRIGRPAVLRFSRASFRPRRPASHWFFDDSASGGLVLDLMIHDFDFARYVAGEVETVMARGVRDDRGLIYAVAILRHKSGALSHLTGSWAHPPDTFRTSFELAGDRGLLRYDSGEFQPASKHLGSETSAGASVGRSRQLPGENPYQAELSDFLVAARTGQPARVDSLDGVAALRIALAAIDSIQYARPICVAEIDEKPR
jgi:predicted dehydrogenase